MLHVGVRTQIFFVRVTVNYCVQEHVFIFEKLHVALGRAKVFVWTQIESNVHAYMCC